MTRLLAIDTSTARGRVALVEGHGEAVRNIVEIDECMELSHATHLIALIDRALAQGGWSKTQLDALAVVRGPGSFTGVRIALGTVQGLALACACPCVGVHTLEAMAEASGACPADRVALLGAGRGELYHARFDAAGSPPAEIAAPSLIRAESLWDDPPGYILWADGVEPPAHIDVSAGRAAATGTAAAAGRIALLRDLREGSVAPLSPLYVRPSDAELQRRRG